MRYTKQEQQEARDALAKVLKPGDTVYCVLRHVSRSGMMRHISFFCIGTDQKPVQLDWYVARLIGLTEADPGLKVGGCGMDMGFHIVYSIGRALFPNGVPCSGAGCQSNDHNNGDRDYTAHTHTDGGYAFRSVWF
ncbi:MAG: hypothetical protein BWX84_00048 [Verrucomicrobia bacterium ADurb.Bin118]|nr:MAG: hypothetical protein BWX84_00048 [Verrucomicrobia bacterium ADurb.Bin118]